MVPGSGKNALAVSAFSNEAASLTQNVKACADDNAQRAINNIAAVLATELDRDWSSAPMTSRQRIEVDIGCLGADKKRSWHERTQCG